ncbi:hypothetical protein ACHAW6_003420, partial [Cyclotella cf. meneghiniana]
IITPPEKKIPPPIAVLSPARLAQLKSKACLASIYTPAGSNAYWELHDHIAQLEADLGVTQAMLLERRGHGSGGEGIKASEAMLRRKQARDPHHVYHVTTVAARMAHRMGVHEKAQRYHNVSCRVKKLLLQFNLKGLWVGNNGKDNSGPPAPIVLLQASAKKWGTKRLPRYPGKRQTAEPGYKNPKYLKGQLVDIGSEEYFSFAWILLEHRIFFGHPSPELTIKVLKEGGGDSLTAGTGNNIPSFGTSINQG